MVRGVGPIPKAEIAGEFLGFVFLVLESNAWKKCGWQGCALHLYSLVSFMGYGFEGPK